MDQEIMASEVAGAPIVPPESGTTLEWQLELGDGTVLRAVVQRIPISEAGMEPNG